MKNPAVEDDFEPLDKSGKAVADLNIVYPQLTQSPAISTAIHHENTGPTTKL